MNSQNSQSARDNAKLNPFLLFHLVLMAIAPWLLVMTMAGLAVGDPLLPSWLEILVLSVPAIALPAWWQWQQPFSPFSLWLVAKSSENLRDRDRQLLALLKQQHNGWYVTGWIAIAVAVVISGIFCKLYALAPLAQAIAPFGDGWRFFGIIYAEICLFLGNIVMQSGISALRLYLATDAELDNLQPIAIDKIKNSFTSLNLLPLAIATPLLKFFDVNETVANNQDNAQESASSIQALIPESQAEVLPVLELVEPTPTEILAEPIHVSTPEIAEALVDSPALDAIPDQENLVAEIPKAIGNQQVTDSESMNQEVEEVVDSTETVTKHFEQVIDEYIENQGTELTEVNTFDQVKSDQVIDQTTEESPVLENDIVEPEADVDELVTEVDEVKPDLISDELIAEVNEVETEETANELTEESTTSVNIDFEEIVDKFTETQVAESFEDNEVEAEQVGNELTEKADEFELEIIIDQSIEEQNSLESDESETETIVDQAEPDIVTDEFTEEVNEAESDIFVDDSIEELAALESDEVVSELIVDNLIDEVSEVESETVVESEAIADKLVEEIYEFNPDTISDELVEESDYLEDNEPEQFIEESILVDVDESEPEQIVDQADEYIEDQVAEFIEVDEVKFDQIDNSSDESIEESSVSVTDEAESEQTIDETDEYVEEQLTESIEISEYIPEQVIDELPQDLIAETTEELETAQEDIIEDEQSVESGEYSIEEPIANIVETCEIRTEQTVAEFIEEPIEDVLEDSENSEFASEPLVVNTIAEVGESLEENLEPPQQLDSELTTNKDTLISTPNLDLPPTSPSITKPKPKSFLFELPHKSRKPKSKTHGFGTTIKHEPAIIPAEESVAPEEPVEEELDERAVLDNYVENVLYDYFSEPSEDAVDSSALQDVEANAEVNLVTETTTETEITLEVDSETIPERKSNKYLVEEFLMDSFFAKLEKLNSDRPNSSDNPDSPDNSEASPESNTTKEPEKFDEFDELEALLDRDQTSLE